MTIAVFDSGLGGISVLYEAMRRLPRERFIYYADTLHVPYGTKPKAVVRDCVMAAVRHIMAQPERVKAVIVACNTATSVAIQELRHTYSIPIVGMEPAVKPAVELTRQSGRRVLVTATPLTLREAKFHELVRRIDDTSIVDSLPLPGLVRLCEELRFEGPDVDKYLREAFEGVRWEDYGTLVLGCTHFPFFRKTLTGMLPPHIRIIDGHAGTVNRLCELIEQWSSPDIDYGGAVRYLSSDGDTAYARKLETALAAYERLSPGGAE